MLIRPSLCGLYVAIYVVLSLSACRSDVAPPAISEIDYAIAEALADAAAANQAVAEIEQKTAGLTTQSKPVAVLAPPTSTIDKPVRVNWKGPVEPLTASLARWAGLSFAHTGKQPVNPIQAVVVGEFKTIAKAIDAVNSSIYGHARVSADETEMVLSLEYR